MVATQGVKESEGKISYQEINWDFVTAMAQRLNVNKTKYPVGNWKKEINLQEIEDALVRHVIKLVNPNPNDTNDTDDTDDPENSLDHLAAIGVNCQILYYHLSNP